MSEPTERCPSCRGEGERCSGLGVLYTCPDCRGTGKVRATAPTGPQSAAEGSVNAARGRHELEAEITDLRQRLAVQRGSAEDAQSALKRRELDLDALRQQQPDTAALLAIVVEMRNDTSINSHLVQSWADRIEALCGKPHAGE